MPVKSKAQVAYLGIHHPEVLRRWKREGYDTSTKGLPEHVKKSKKRRSSSEKLLMEKVSAFLLFAERARVAGKKKLAREIDIAAGRILYELGYR